MRLISKGVLFSFHCFELFAVCYACPADWYPSSIGTCYRAFVKETALSGILYTDFCKQQGGYPAVLYSSADLEEGKIHFPNVANHDYMFIGLTDNTNEDQWLWMDGEPLAEYVTMKFGVGQPNGETEQNCNVVNSIFELHDYPCCDFSASPDIHICLCEMGGNNTSSDVDRLTRGCNVTVAGNESDTTTLQQQVSQELSTSATTVGTSLSQTTQINAEYSTFSVSTYHPIITPSRCTNKNRENGRKAVLPVFTSSNGLKVNKNSTSTYKRRFISAGDNRSSSKIIGWMSATLLTLEFLGFIAMDTVCKTKHENKRRMDRGRGKSR